MPGASLQVLSGGLSAISQSCGVCHCPSVPCKCLGEDNMPPPVTSPWSHNLDYHLTGSSTINLRKTPNNHEWEHDKSDIRVEVLAGDEGRTARTYCSDLHQTRHVAHSFKLVLHRLEQWCQVLPQGSRTALHAESIQIAHSLLRSASRSMDLLAAPLSDTTI
jgi:hypothetical protein